jgi:hypothetical protein
MLGDLENQAIYQAAPLPDNEGPHALLRRRSPDHFVFPLRVNCRNTAQVASGIEIACGLVPGYSRLVRGEPGPDIETHFFQEPREQEDILRRCLTQSTRHFAPGEIVVLSSREDRMSCAGQLVRRSRSLALAPLRAIARAAREIGYTTIHAFKGLEAPVVILTDIESVSRDDAVALLYVGMSRARFQLVILLPEKLREQWSSRVQAGFVQRAQGRNRT